MGEDGAGAAKGCASATRARPITFDAHGSFPTDCEVRRRDPQWPVYVNSRRSIDWDECSKRRVELTRSKLLSGTGGPGASVAFRHRPQSGASVSLAYPAIGGIPPRGHFPRPRRRRTISSLKRGRRRQEIHRIRPGRLRGRKSARQSPCTLSSRPGAAPRASQSRAGQHAPTLSTRTGHGHLDVSHIVPVASVMRVSGSPTLK